MTGITLQRQLNCTWDTKLRMAIAMGMRTEKEILLVSKISNVIYIYIYIVLYVVVNFYFQLIFV